MAKADGTSAVTRAVLDEAPDDAANGDDFTEDGSDQGEGGPEEPEE
jgi:hypothetical protein